MDIYVEIVRKIITEQETIIGPVAIEQAIKVEGLIIDAEMKNITINGDKKEIVVNLVKTYETLFGRTSLEVCKEAVQGIISRVPKDQVPQVLL